MGGQGSKGCSQGLLQFKVEDKKVREIPKDQERSAEVVDAPKEDKVKVPSEPISLLGRRSQRRMCVSPTVRKSEPMIAKEEEAPTEASTEDEELTEAPQASSPGPSDVDSYSDSGETDKTLLRFTESPAEASTETLQPVEASTQSCGWSAAELVDLEFETPEKEKAEQQVGTPNCKVYLYGHMFRNAEDELVVLTTDDLKDMLEKDALRLAEESKAAKNKKTAALGAMTFLLALKSDA